MPASTTPGSISACAGSDRAPREADIRPAIPASATILAFHGGGFLGYFSAQIANALQARRQALGSQGALRQSFDAITGTSVGAILAAAVATDTPMETVVELMKSRGEKIFPRRRFFATAPGIFGARFSQAPLRALLEEILGPVRLGELDRVVIIPAVNESRGVPVIFRSTNPAHWDLRLVDVVLASAAAPLFLPLHRIGSERFTDGGLVANAPALIASADLTRTFGIGPGHQRVISIGTTRASGASAVPMRRRDAWGGVRWIWGGGRLQQLLMDGQEGLQSEILAGLGPAGRLHLDMQLGPDDAGKVNIVRADSVARSILEKAAALCAERVSVAERDFLDRCLSRRARTLAWQRSSRGEARPVLVAAR